ncbi:MAG: protein kinase [Candidatus Obscuribacter sp.]|nr:protein kinase [Candidatus Obscuribacter sp.]
MDEDQEKSRFFRPGSGTVKVATPVADTLDQASERALPNRTYTPGHVIDGKFQVVGFLGEGGMGTVYRVHHMTLGKDLALKTFRSEQIDQEAWLRFQREAQSIGRLEHANIIRIYDFGIAEDNRPYYAMELLTGADLAERLSRGGAMPLRLTLQVFIQVAGALEHAHQCGVVHRDIKPANIHLNDDDPKRPVAKLVDFGIAKLATSENQRLTSAGLVFGSPLYMSPEQAMGADIDARSDIYSLGCTLFECLTEKPPFLGENIVDTLTRHQQENPPNLADVDIGSRYPQRLEGLVRRMLVKDPEKRIASMKEVKQELTDLLETLKDTATVDLQPMQSVTQRNTNIRGIRSKKSSQENSTPPIPESLKQEGRQYVLITAIALAVVAVLAGTTLAVTHFLTKAAPPPTDQAQAVPKVELTSIIPDEDYKKLPKELPGIDVSQEVLPNGTKVSKMNFPKHGIGKVGVLGEELVSARGKLTFPTDKKLVFKPNTWFLEKTERWSVLLALHIWEISFPENIEVTEEMLIHTNNPTLKVRSLSFRNSRLEGPLVNISHNPELKSLDLSNTKLFKNDTYGTIFQDSPIVRLCIDEISQADLNRLIPQLKSCKNLVALRFDNSTLNSESLREIVSLSKLSTLELRSCGIDDKGLAALAKLNHLKRLHLGKAALTAASVDTIKQMKELRYLAVDLHNNPRLAALLQREMSSRGGRFENSGEDVPDYTDFLDAP